MKITVRLAGPLRALAGNISTCQLDGCRTVGEALRALIGGHEALGPRLLSPDGALHHFVTAYVNAQDVRLRQLLDTPLADGDELTLVPAVSGG